MSPLSTPDKHSEFDCIQIKITNGKLQICRIYKHYQGETQYKKISNVFKIFYIKSM